MTTLRVRFIFDQPLLVISPSLHFGVVVFVYVFVVVFVYVFVEISKA